MCCMSVTTRGRSIPEHRNHRKRLLLCPRRILNGPTEFRNTDIWNDKSKVDQQFRGQVNLGFWPKDKSSITSVSHGGQWCRISVKLTILIMRHHGFTQKTFKQDQASIQPKICDGIDRFTTSRKYLVDYIESHQPSMSWKLLLQNV